MYRDKMTDKLNYFNIFRHFFHITVITETKQVVTCCDSVFSNFLILNKIHNTHVWEFENNY